MLLKLRLLRNNRGEVDPSGEAEKVTVTKAELDDLRSKNTKLEKDLEDVRMEVLTPEYEEFLTKKEKGTTPDPKPAETPADDFEKLSKKEIFERARKAAVEDVKNDLKKEREESKKEADSRVKREIAKFAKDHPDYEKYRPMMYGLSTLPEHADKTIGDLYTEAKNRVAELAGTTPEEKKKQQRMNSEKPGADNLSFEEPKTLKGKSNDQIAREALADVQEKLGPLPSA
jgi:hypothetical protein